MGLISSRILAKKTLLPVSVRKFGGGISVFVSGLNPLAGSVQASSTLCPLP